MIGSEKAPWDGIALVCRKCTRKLDGGFGEDGDEKLSKALRQGLKAAGRRRALRVMEVGCFGLCPKRAVAVSTSAVPGALLVVDRGTPMAEVVAAVLDHGHA